MYENEYIRMKNLSFVCLTMAEPVIRYELSNDGCAIRLNGRKPRIRAKLILNLERKTKNEFITKSLTISSI